MIQFWYDKAAGSFEEEMRKIRTHEPPYYYTPEIEESSCEPAFLEESETNDEALEMTGYSAITMLQVAMRAFFDAYKAELSGVDWKSVTPKNERDGNWFTSYGAQFKTVLHQEWTSFPDYAIVDQVTMIRDDIFHYSSSPDEALLLLALPSVRQRTAHFAKYNPPFFVSDRHLGIQEREGDLPFGDKTWTIYVGREKIERAIQACGAFCEWCWNYPSHSSLPTEVEPPPSSSS